MMRSPKRSISRPAGSSTCHRVMIISSAALSLKRENTSSVNQFQTFSRVPRSASARPLIGSSMMPRSSASPVIAPSKSCCENNLRADELEDVVVA